MEYGRIAGNSSIDAKIKYCFQFIHEDDARQFVKKLASLPQVDDTVDERLHVFRELIIGAYLGRQGLHVRYSKPVDGKTPDWSILADTDALAALVEVVTFHWGAGPTADRLYATVQGKFSTYKNLADRHAIPYVVGIHIDFMASVDTDDIVDCLYHGEYGLFAQYPGVSGAIFFDIMGACYPMTYYRNPQATRPFIIPNGVF